MLHPCCTPKLLRFLLTLLYMSEMKMRTAQLKWNSDNIIVIQWSRFCIFNYEKTLIYMDGESSKWGTLLGPTSMEIYMQEGLSPVIGGNQASRFCTFNYENHQNGNWSKSSILIGWLVFASSGWLFGTPLLFSIYLRHGFCSESEDVEANRVKKKRI